MPLRPKENPRLAFQGLGFERRGNGVKGSGTEGERGSGDVLSKYGGRWAWTDRRLHLQPCHWAIVHQASTSWCPCSWNEMLNGFCSGSGDYSSNHQYWAWPDNNVKPEMGIQKKFEGLPVKTGRPNTLIYIDILSESHKNANFKNSFSRPCP